MNGRTISDVGESVMVTGDERTGDDDMVGVCDVPRPGHAEPESVAVLRLRLAGEGRKNDKGKRVGN